MDDVPDELAGLIEHVVFSGVLQDAVEENNRRLEADPEWSQENIFSIGTLVEAFAIGVLHADPWYVGYRVPPRFEEVCNYISACIQHDLKSRIYCGTLIRISLIEARRLYLLWGEANPYFMAWNEVGDNEKTIAGMAIVTAFDSVAKQRRFIDLHALVQNAAIHLRTCVRVNNEFDRTMERDETIRQLQAEIAQLQKDRGG